MAPYEILLSLFSSTEFTSIVNLMVRTIIDQIITKKNSNVQKWQEELIRCIDDTQCEFAKCYNYEYSKENGSVLGPLLQLYGSTDRNNVLLSDVFISELIHYTFKVSTKNEMITIWKNIFTKTISKNEYKVLLAKINLLIEKPNLLKNIKTNIFLSYCWKDKELANNIDSFFENIGISLKRDVNSIDQWDSIRLFMDTIVKSDYAILIISESYLKSINCMYEITQLIKDPHYRNRIFPVVLDKSIYTLNGRINYITYWEKEYDEIKEKSKKIKNIENTSDISKELLFIRNISSSISEFLSIISDMNNPDIDNINEAILLKLKMDKII